MLKRKNTRNKKIHFQFNEDIFYLDGKIYYLFVRKQLEK